MKHNGLDHPAIFVPDTETALKTCRDTQGSPLLYSEVVNGGTVWLTHLDLGNTHLQLVEPLTLDHSLQVRFAKNGSIQRNFPMTWMFIRARFPVAPGNRFAS